MEKKKMHEDSQFIRSCIFKSKMKASQKDLFWYVRTIEIKSTKKVKQPQYIVNTKVTDRKELAPKIQASYQKKKH